MIRYLKDVTTLELFEEKCTGCGMCVEVCPQGVMKVENGLAGIIDRDACMECSACARNCPEEAIFVQAGVGCAQAVINSALGRSSTTCCGIDDYETQDQACGSGEVSSKKRSTGCC